MPEPFLDFDVKYFPEELSFDFYPEDPPLYKSCDIINIRKAAQVLKFEFHIAWSDTTHLVKKQGFRVWFPQREYNSEDFGNVFECSLPATGNLLNLYQSKYKLLEDIFNEILSEMEKEE